MAAPMTAPTTPASVRSLPRRFVHQEWMENAACRGQTHLFFPPHAERPQARERREAKAARICATCDVLAECRRYARVNREYGFWGGESEEDRGRAGYPVPLPVGGRSLLPARALPPAQRAARALPPAQRAARAQRSSTG
jgi:WhiB family transcriptional regulator, redox-sensing transcriptional regulator